MYLFNKAKESVIKSFQYDISSPIAKLTSLCKLILKHSFVFSLSLTILLLSTKYYVADIQNKNLIEIFALFLLIKTLLSFVILRREHGVYTLSKIKMYPFSFKELVDISLTTGTITISLFDIFLGYVYLIIAFLSFVTAMYSIYITLETPYMQDNENLNTFTLQFCSIFYAGLYILSQYRIFRAMPYHPLEYLTFIFKNIGEDIISIIKFLWSFIF